MSRSLLQLAPYAQLIAWTLIGAATVVGAAVGAVIGARLTRTKETR